MSLKVILSGFETLDQARSFLNWFEGREIVAATLSDDDELFLTFADGVRIQIRDNGQSCCEHRYIQTDDDVKTLVGNRLMSISIKNAPNEENEYGEHEVQFLEVQTSGGLVTFAAHNEHNGYYGGFALGISEV